MDSKNDEQEDHIEPEIPLEAKITKLRLTNFDHVIYLNSLEKSIILGTVEETTKQHQQVTSLRGSIKQNTALNLEILNKDSSKLFIPRPYWCWLQRTVI